MIILLLFSPLLLKVVLTQMTCGPRVSPRMMMDIPCDMSKNNFCQVPGGGYPWSSVRRYIYENQGLMRRMYGDQRHSFVIRNEIEDLHDKYYPSSHFASSRSENRVKPMFSPRSLDISSEVTMNSQSTFSTSSESSSSTSTSTTESASSSSVEDKLEPTSTEFEESISSSTSSSSTQSSSSQEQQSSSPRNTDSPIPPTTSTTPSPSHGYSTTEESEATTANFTNKKGINACPVKEEVIAPFWANNTRVSHKYCFLRCS